MRASEEEGHAIPGPGKIKNARPRAQRRVTGRTVTSLASASVAALFLSAAEDSIVPPKSERAPEIRLAADIVTIPIAVVKGFPFIEGSAGGVSGKFMLDTGSEQALTINDHRVPVVGSREIGSGHFGSGQRFAVRLAPEVAQVHLGALSFRRATMVQTQDARLLESITPDFLGWFGHHGWADHAMKLDYRASRATFYKGGPEAYLKGEKVIAELAFVTRKLPNHPLIQGRIGGLKIVGSWDSGQYGALFTTEAGKAMLLRSQRLTVSRNEAGTFDLTGLKLAGHSFPIVESIEVATTPSAAAAPIGICESHVVTIGYGVLRRYKSVWDYRRRRIYLLEPQAPSHR